MGESLYGRVLLCPGKLSAWDKAVSPGAPIGERGIFLNRPLPHSVSVSFAQAEGPLMRGSTVVALFWLSLMTLPSTSRSGSTTT